MEYREIMRAENAPDVYDGPTCDGIRPRWMGSAEGDQDGDDEVGRDGAILLAARTFPPGTKISIQSPLCPKCHETPHDMGDFRDDSGNWFTKWSCGCDFDWREFTLDNYS